MREALEKILVRERLLESMRAEEYTPEHKERLLVLVNEQNQEISNFITMYEGGEKCAEQ